MVAIYKLLLEKVKFEKDVVFRVDFKLSRQKNRCKMHIWVFSNFWIAVNTKQNAPQSFKNLISKWFKHLKRVFTQTRGGIWPLMILCGTNKMKWRMSKHIAVVTVMMPTCSIYIVEGKMQLNKFTYLACRCRWTLQCGPGKWHHFGMAWRGTRWCQSHIVGQRIPGRTGTGRSPLCLHIFQNAHTGWHLWVKRLGISL